MNSLETSSMIAMGGLFSPWKRTIDCGKGWGRLKALSAAMFLDEL